MNTSLAIDGTEIADHETLALKELNAFLERPNSIGLDSLKEVLRNTVQLMMEIKGYDTGYMLQHLMNGEHSSLAPSGTLKGDAEKKRKAEELQELLRQLEIMLAKDFARMFTHVQTRINVITENIENRIEKLDETIESAIADGLDEEIIDKKKQKRSRLKMFMKRIKEREVELADVETTEEVIEVEAKLSRDVADLRMGSPEPEAPEVMGPSFGMLSTVMQSQRQSTPYAYHNYNTTRSDSDESGSGETGSGDQDEGIEPPRAHDL